MINFARKFPWFASAALVAVFTAGAAFVAYEFTGDLFLQTCKNEVNLLTGAIDGDCKGGKAAGVAPVTNPTGEIVLSGQFQDGEAGHKGSGRAEIQRLADGTLNLRLADFAVTNGPDLFVYLTTEPDGGVSEFLDLGRLEANNGNQNYAIPAGTDITRYRSALIWCRQFKTNFAYATLEGKDRAVSAAATPPSPPASATKAPSSAPLTPGATSSAAQSPAAAVPPGTPAGPTTALAATASTVPSSPTPPPATPTVVPPPPPRPRPTGLVSSPAAHSETAHPATPAAARPRSNASPTAA